MPYDKSKHGSVLPRILHVSGITAFDRPHPKCTLPWAVAEPAANPLTRNFSDRDNAIPEVQVLEVDVRVHLLVVHVLLALPDECGCGRQRLGEEVAGGQGDVHRTQGRSRCPCTRWGAGSGGETRSLSPCSFALNTVTNGVLSVLTPGGGL